MAKTDTTPRHGAALVAAAGVLALMVGGTLGLRDPGGRSHSGTSGAQLQAPVATPITATAQPVTWAPCPAELPDLECATIGVPLDHGRPDGERISLAISRRKHTTTPYRGTILVNPGGPGSSGRMLAGSGGNIARGIGDSYDWIGFDPRGIGASRPALACDPAAWTGLRPPYVPTKPEIMQAWLTKATTYAASCGKASGALLNHVRTIDTVHDMEWIRAALGAETTSYWGNSYGSLLGQLYTTAYPGRVNKMVLDGVVDASQSWYDANLAQNVALTANFEAFLKWLAANPASFGLGSDPAAIKARYAAKLDALAAAPGAGGTVSAADLNDLAIRASYGVSTWPADGAVLSQVLRRDNVALLAPDADAGQDNARAGYLAVQCSESAWPGWDTMKADAERQHPDHPLMTWSNTWMNAPCAFWPVPSQPRAAVDAARVTAPILLVSETLDGATPFAGALATRERFPTARLIEGTGGTTHSSAIAAGPCVAGAIADFLEKGTLPPRREGRTADLQCAPVPPPPAAPADPAAPAAQ